MKEKIINVSKEEKLIDILKNHIKDLSIKKLKSFVKYKMVSVDGQVCTNSSSTIKSGSTVNICFPDFDTFENKNRQRFFYYGKKLVKFLKVFLAYVVRTLYNGYVRWYNL